MAQHVMTNEDDGDDECKDFLSGLLSSVDVLYVAGAHGVHAGV